MSKQNIQLLKDLYQLDRLISSKLMRSKFINRKEINNLKELFEFIEIELDITEGLTFEFTKIYFCRLCILHPKTKNFKISFIQNYWETIVNNSN
jgi:hypothetical protein